MRLSVADHTEGNHKGDGQVSLMCFHSVLVLFGFSFFLLAQSSCNYLLLQIVGYEIGTQSLTK